MALASTAGELFLSDEDISKEPEDGSSKVRDLRV